MRWLKNQFELSRNSGSYNLKPMEGLRGFAVFLVFLVHYVTLIKPWISEQSNVHPLADSLHTIGNAGVDLFFVLSGYLIYGSLIARPQPILKFLLRRVKRIYPAFIVVFVTYIFLSFVFPAENKIPSDLLNGIVYLAQNFLLLPGFFPVEPMITVAWSLSYEMFYYLLIPLIITVFSLRNRRANWRLGFFLVSAVLIAIYFSTNGGHIRLLMFISGILLFDAINCNYIPTPSSNLSALALVLGLLGTLLPLGGSAGSTLETSILFGSFFILCLTCFRSPSAWISRLFSWTPLRWLGNMSYSYYLLHGLALKACFLILSKVAPNVSYGSWLFWVMLVPIFLLTLIPTTMLYLLVERPFSLLPHKEKAKPTSVSPEILANNEFKFDTVQEASRLP